METHPATGEILRRRTNPFDAEYHKTLIEITKLGTAQTDRTGTGTQEIFGMMMRFDLSDGTVPLLTTKKVSAKNIIKELLWMIGGCKNVYELISQNVHIWSEWPCKHWLRSTCQALPTTAEGWKSAVKDFEQQIMDNLDFRTKWGELGPIYGYQWRSWPGPNGPIDQLKNSIERLKTHPDCRRNIVESWNVGLLDEMAIAGLPPCHKSFQFNVCNGKLSIKVEQRSCDMFLGVPYNIFFYSALLAMIAQVTGLERGELIWVGGSCHIYNNHVEQVKEQLSRESFPAPLLELDPSIMDIDDFRLEHFSILDYTSHDGIKAPIAV